MDIEKHIPQAHLVGYLDGRSSDDFHHELDSSKSFVILHPDRNLRGDNKTAFMARFKTHTWLSTMFASYVGKGMLSGLIIPTAEDSEQGEGDEDKKKELEDVSGIVTFNIGPSESGAKIQDLMGDANAVPGAGISILMKICGALVSHDYDFETISKVGALVSRNLITAAVWDTEFNDSISQTSEDTPESVLEEGISRQVQKMLTEMLDPNVHRTRNVRVNSNEPVLLINVEEKTKKSTRDIFIAESIKQLQNQWNIWPVRIYVHAFMAALEPQFSITLLNVVNTDIGGPSMVQLLDTPCDAPGWNEFILKESWRDRNFISREEQSGSDTDGSSISELSETTSIASSRSESEAQHAETGSVPSKESDKEPEHDEASSQSQNSPKLAGNESKDDSSFNPSTEQQHSLIQDERSGSVSDEIHDKVPSSDLTEPTVEPHDPINTDNAVDTEHEEYQFDQRNIQHPTWQHSIASETLADLIRAQTSKLNVSEPSHPISDSKDSVKEEHEAGFESDFAETDEGFELV